MRCPSCDKSGYDPAKPCPNCRFSGDPGLVEELVHIDWILGEIEAWRAFEAHPVTKERLAKRYAARQRELEIELGLRLAPFTEEEAGQVDIMNLPNTRWAVREDFEPWINCEPTKGDGLRVRFLFDEERGQHPEMQVGIGEIGPNIHYTLHYHAMPEIYYVLGGEGIIYLGDGEVAVHELRGHPARRDDRPACPVYKKHRPVQLNPPQTTPIFL